MPPAVVVNSIKYVFMLPGLAFATFQNYVLEGERFVGVLLFGLGFAAVGLAIENAVERALQRSNDRRLAKYDVPGPRAATSELQKPGPVAGGPLERARLEITKMIEEEQRFIGVQGEPGIGKSTLVRSALSGPELTRRFSVHGDRRYEIDFDHHEATATAAIDLLGQRLGGADHSDVLVRLSRRRSVVVLDHIEHYLRGNEGELVKLLNWLGAAKRTTVILVVQGRRLDEVARYLRPGSLVGSLPTVTLDRANAEDAERMFRLFAPSLEGHDVTALLQHLGGLPRALRLVATSIQADIAESAPRQSARQVLARMEKILRSAEFAELRAADRSEFDDLYGPDRSDPDRHVDLETAIRLALGSTFFPGRLRRSF